MRQLMNLYFLAKMRKQENQQRCLVRPLSPEKPFVKGSGETWTGLRELVGLFVKDTVRLLGRITNAVTHKYADEPEKAAHGLKSSVLNFVTKRVDDIAQALETMGKNRDLTKAQNAVADLESQVESMRRKLEGGLLTS
jgi:hypothetical protein